MSRIMLRLGRIVALWLLVCGAGAQEDGPHWGAEVGGSYLEAPRSVVEAFQDRYRASVNGISYAVGLVRFHSTGAPNFSLQFIQFRVDGSATDNWSLRRYEGSARVPGFIATKHANVFARYRASVGFSFGAGVGPQLKADYREMGTGAARTYRLRELAVTPLFQVLIRGDVRVARSISVGPFFGIRNGLLTGGGTIRVHFLK